MRQAIYYIVPLHYKIRMMCVPFEGANTYFCDNNAVVIDSTRLNSTSNRKRNSVAYHRAQEVQAGNIVRIEKKGTSTKIAEGPPVFF